MGEHRANKESPLGKLSQYEASVANHACIFDHKLPMTEVEGSLYTCECTAY